MNVRTLFSPRVLAAAFVAVLPVLPLAATSKADRIRPPMIEEGTSVEGVLHPGQDNGTYQTFRITVPENAIAIRLRITAAQADLDIFANYLTPIDDYHDADYVSETDEYLEDLIIHKLFNPPIRPGIWYVDVAYQIDDRPRREGRVLEDVPFVLSYEAIVADDPRAILPGRPVDLVLDESNLYVQVLALDVPAGTPSLRVDVTDTVGDIDLFLSKGDPSIAWDEALLVADTYLGRESAVLEGGPGGLEAGRYYVTVIDGYETDIPVALTLRAVLGDAPPPLALPSLPRTGTPAELGRLATVQIINRSGTGSGCLVSPGGLILTDDHVVRDYDGELISPIWVAVCLDPFLPPVELFSAEVVSSLEVDDLAILRITGDLYGRALPPGYRFPSWRLGDPSGLSLGDPLYVLGYPSAGSGTSRIHFTLTRGVLSGGERAPGGIALKTDALISGGGSGGAVADGSYGLVGLPAFVVNDDGGQMTYFLPIDRIPRDWKDRIAADQD